MTNKIMLIWITICLGVSTEFERRWRDIEEGDVLAWSRHITGQDTTTRTTWHNFKSVAVIPGYKKECGDDRLDDEVWAVVERTIGGTTYKFIEQFQALDWGDDPNYCWFVDAGVSLSRGSGEGGGSIPAQLGDYPILNPTTDQPDPGLPHTTPVSTLEDLENMNNDLDGNYYLTNDIDASETSDPSYIMWYRRTYGWWVDVTGWGPIGTPYGAPANIGPFTGTLDGCGYTISGLYCEHIHPALETGLFGHIGGDAKIANLTIEFTAYDCRNAVGALAGTVGYSYQTDNILIQNVNVTADLDPEGSSHGSIGGLIGTIEPNSPYYINIYDCSAVVDINSLEATTTISSIGGLVGRALGANIYNCYATGSIHINAGNNRERIGGLCGRFGATAGTYGETMEYCYSTIDVAGTTWIGGLVGQYYGSINDGGYIRKCYSTGNVSNVSQNVSGYGGLIGNIATAGEVTDCYAWGNVSTVDASSVGGAFGGVAASSVITNVYSIGAVTGTGGAGDIGGLSGDPQESGTWNAAYWDTETSGQATSKGGVGQTTTWLKTRPNFTAAGWDISATTSTIWYQVYTPPKDVDTDSYYQMPYTGDVCVYADGRPIGVYTADANGVIDLDSESFSVVIAGINYYSIYESFPLNVRGMSYPSSIRDVKIDFYESMGCHVGVDIDNSVDWIFSYDDFATAIDPLTEIKRAPFLWGTTREPVIHLYEWEPIPLSVRGIYPKLNTSVE